MILTLAFRNLFHDRIRLAVTLIGILFSIVLVAVQLGLYLGASKMITSMIDKSNGELWITTFEAKSFEEGGVLLGPGIRHKALATAGVKDVVPLISSFAEWRKPAGGSTRIVLVMRDLKWAMPAAVAFTVMRYTASERGPSWANGAKVTSLPLGV